jgi:hypothetical protein
MDWEKDDDIFITLSVILILIVVSLLFLNQQDEFVKLKYDSKIKTVQLKKKEIENDFLQKQVVEQNDNKVFASEIEDKTEKIALLEKELIDSSVKNSISDYCINWVFIDSDSDTSFNYKKFDSNNILKDNIDDRVFYYTTKLDTFNDIRMYNAKDVYMHGNGSFNIAIGENVLYTLNNKDSSNIRFILLAVTEDKIIFAEEDLRSSPGPCFSPWYLKTFYIEKDSENPERQEYVIPESKLIEMKEGRESCLKDL